MKQVRVSVRGYSVSEHKPVAAKEVNDGPNTAAQFAGFAVETFLRQENVDFIVVRKVKVKE